MRLFTLSAVALLAVACGAPAHRETPFGPTDLAIFTSHDDLSVPDASPSDLGGGPDFDLACSADLHECAGACVSKLAPATCGASCSPCVPPTHATSTCDGVTCGFTCDAGFAAFGNVCVGTKTWTSVAKLPTPRAALAAARAGDKVYFIGGYGGEPYQNRVALGVVEVLDLPSRTWTTAAAMPTPRYAFGLTIGNDGRFYAIGGSTNATSDDFIAKVEAYDPASNTWSTLPDLPTPRTSLSASTDPNGKIYALGGFNSAVLKTVEVMDPATHAWSAIANLPTAVSGHASVAATSGVLHVVGGSNNAGAGGAFQVVGANQAYDRSVQSWATKKLMPTARNGLSVVRLRDGKLMVMGGWASSFWQSAVEIYDPASDAWTTAAALPTPLGSAATTLDLAGNVILAGGIDAASAFVSDVLVYPPGP